MQMRYTLIGALVASVLLNAFFLCRPFAWPKLYLSYVRYAFLRRPDFDRAEDRIRTVLKEQSFVEWFEIESFTSGQWLGVLWVLTKQPVEGVNWTKVKELTDRLTKETGVPCWCAGSSFSKEESDVKRMRTLIIGIGYERPPKDVLFPKESRQTTEQATAP
jgi:hypothetical protein